MKKGVLLFFVGTLLTQLTQAQTIKFKSPPTPGNDPNV
jgi:hypothetical protein